MSKCEDLTGKKFGRLTVMSRAKNCKNYAMWNCRCDCGNEIAVRTSSLKSGHTKSCGCYHRDVVSKANTTHGHSNSRLYRIYQHMIRRCSDEKENGYENYGGRGISVCKTWREDFEQFYSWAMNNGYEDSLSIDRIDVNGDYEPSNCRWATSKEQANNQRSNRILNYNGKDYTMSELADKFQISYNVLDSRIYRGWDIKTAVETPVSRSERNI